MYFIRSRETKLSINEPLWLPSLSLGLTRNKISYVERLMIFPYKNNYKMIYVAEKLGGRQEEKYLKTIAGFKVQKY